MSNILSNQESMELLEREGHHAPSPGSWGIATKDSSTGGFWWFKNQNTLIDFISRALPSIEKDLEEINDFKEQVAMHHKYIEEYKRDYKQALPIIFYHNNHFASDIELVWIGSFNELLQSGNEFPSFVREEFHESNAPVDQKDADEFTEFVGEDVGWMGLYPSINAQLESSKEVFEAAHENSAITDNSILLFLETGSDLTRYFHPMYVFDNLEQWKSSIPFITSMDINNDATEPTDFFYPVVNSQHFILHNHYKNSVWNIPDFESLVEKIELDSGRIIFAGSLRQLLESDSKGARWIFDKWKENDPGKSLAEYLNNWNEDFLA